jgi:hypothetical protein
VSDAEDQGPRLGERGRGAKAAREERLASEMRSNLKKRKAQARTREGAGEARRDDRPGRLSPEH